jgi:hypothetical protein
MRVLLVGTLPPPGGVNARRFAREAARRSVLGDSVETLSADPLSISHRTATLRGRHLARELRALSGEFDGVELRVESALALTPRSVGKVIAALRRYQHVTLFMDSPVPFSSSERGVLARLCSSSHTVVFASESDLGSMASVPGGPDFPSGPEKILAPPEPSDMAPPLPAWPKPGSSSLQEVVLDTVRVRARTRLSGSQVWERTSMLATASDRVHPSFKGSSIWLMKRVIGKSRGAVTKVLRPTPRKAQ